MGSAAVAAAFEQLALLDEYMQWRIQFIAPRLDSLSLWSTRRPWAPSFGRYQQAVWQHEVYSVHPNPSGAGVFRPRVGNGAEQLYWIRTYFTAPAAPATV